MHDSVEPDVFISYARANNEERAAITHEVTAVIDHFIEVYWYVAGFPQDRPKSSVFYMDTANGRDGQRIPEAIGDAIKSCPVMLAFTSPEYFRSEWCFREWQEFKRAQEVDRQQNLHPRLLIPIEVKPVDRNKIDNLTGERAAWVAELVTSDGLHHSVTAAALLSKNSEKLAHQLGKVQEAIEEHRMRRRRTTPERRTKTNVLVVKSPIEQGTLHAQNIQDEIESNADVLRYQSKPVCLLYTGGTVGMVRQNTSDTVHEDYIMAKDPSDLMPYLQGRLSALPLNVHFFALNPTIDSSNIKPENWVALARLLQEQMDNYQGFVILHGTNTLAYTAAALSFLLNGVVDRPVVITGAEVPLSVANTDAIHNVENAIRAAAWDSYNGPMRVPEVCVYWNNFLFRGSRVTKKVASDRVSSFHAPNMPTPLAVLNHDRIRVERNLLLADQRTKLPSTTRPTIVDLDANVGVILLHPNFDYSSLNRDRLRALDGLVLLSYGSGNTPDDEEFISLIKDLLSCGTIVANITQCPYGRVALKLFETSAKLFDLGVIDGDDLTLEAAYCKLLWAISSVRSENRRQAGVRDNIRRTFQRSLIGEMSMSIYTASLGDTVDFAKLKGNGYYMSDMVSFKQEFHKYDIADAFLRFEGFQAPHGQRSFKVEVLFGPPMERVDPDLPPANLLAEFSKTLSEEELTLGQFDKNIEITHVFRKSFDSQDFQVSIRVSDDSRPAFKSARLVVYASDGGRR